MDFRLTQEQDMLVEAVRSFVEKELLPHEDDVDRADAVSPELAAQIRGKALAAGFYAFNMPEEVGGGGLDYLSQALVERELSKVSWALHVFVARPSKILMACTGEQLGDYLLPCVQGENRLLRPHRAGRRLRRQFDQDPRGARRRRLRDKR